MKDVIFAIGLIAMLLGAAGMDSDRPLVPAVMTLLGAGVMLVTYFKFYKEEEE